MITNKRLKEIIACSADGDEETLKIAQDLLACKQFIWKIKEENQSELALRCSPGNYRAME